MAQEGQSALVAGLPPHQVVAGEDWRAARLALLDREKQLTRLRDEVAAERRRLPWQRVSKRYVFRGADGEQSLPDLFAGRSQLLVYHFMFGPDWAEGCPSCSFWADSYDGVAVHLAHRDVSLVAVSRAPWPALDAYQRRMGWSFRWYSSQGSDFNRDYHVSFDPGDGPAEYNYREIADTGDELPGISAFVKDAGGDVYHTYSAYSRGLDALNSGYQLLDLVAKGRDEASLPWSMAWLRRHDAYRD
jgi:predicted dithiol-disulfide oxidoreductase (DUF899 family)